MALNHIGGVHNSLDSESRDKIPEKLVLLFAHKSFAALEVNTHKMTLSIVVLSLTLLSVVKSEESISTTQCIIDYLKTANQTSAGLQTNEKCDKIIKSFDDAYERDIWARLKAADNQTCIIKLFRDYKIFELFLKGFSSHSLNLTKVSDFKAEARETTTDILKAVQASCTAEERFGKMFDESVESLRDDTGSIVDSSSQSCIKKYYFEKGILDAAEFNVDASKINATDCDDIAQELDNSLSNTVAVDESLTFYGLPSASVQRCSNERFVEQKVLLKLASFEVAVKLGLSPLQVRKLRSDYITWMAANVRFLLECLSELFKL